MTNMHKAHAVLLAFALTTLCCMAESHYKPEGIVRCLGSPKTDGLTILTDINPFYLRGDFDGDGRSDYAVQVRSGTDGTGVLICAGNDSIFLLGSGINGGSRFSDMERDAFLAPRWEVFTKEAVGGLQRFQSNVPRPVSSVKAEAIAMIWEDGISLIYWNGDKFRWAGSRE